MVSAIGWLTSNVGSDAAHSSASSWAQFAAVYCRTRAAHAEHEKSKTELKALVPEDAGVAYGHGVRAKRSKAGAISFDLLAGELGHAPLQ